MSSLDQQLKAAMEASIEHLKAELKTLRTGRANPSMLDKVRVDQYGTPVPLKQVATVSTPEPRQLLITPFDPQTLHAIAKGIEVANLGFTCVVDGRVVRVNVPVMDAALRKKMAEQCKEMAEKTKISVREIRRKFNDLIRKQKSAGEIPEDLMKKQEKSIQEMTDKYCKEADRLSAEKEQEVMTV